jgi:hypothetical protein
MSTPGGESMSLYTDLMVDAAGGNSSPDFLAMPVAYFPIGDTVVYNPLPYDIDGDSLSWSLNVPYSAVNFPTFDSVVGFVPPSADPAGPFSMNPVSGEITWIPNQLGNFVQSFIVDEYRNGVKIGSIIRDFQYVIVPPDTNNPNSPMITVNSPFMTYNSAQNYNYMNYYAGEPASFTVTGSDLDAGATLSLNSYSEIFNLVSNPATFSVASSASNLIGTFNWTPNNGYVKDVLLVFRLRDGLWTRDETILLKNRGWSLSVQQANSTETGVTAFPNPASNKLNVSINLSNDINGEVALFSAVGQKVQTIASGKLAKGSNMLTADLNLAPGMYYLTVKDGSSTLKTQAVSIK